MPTNRSRRGATSFELMVAATLLLASLGTLYTAVPQLGRLWRSSRDYHLAINELANQLERLTLLSDSNLDSALEQLPVSNDLLAVVPTAKLSHRIVEDKSGKRIVLSIQWDREPDARPITMTGWLVTQPASLPNGSSKDPESIPNEVAAP